MFNTKIAVVVPTIRDEKFQEFCNAWNELFTKHDVVLVAVKDGKKPVVNVRDYKTGKTATRSVKDIMGSNKDLIYNFNDGVRNLGFAFAVKETTAEVIITLDDDVLPIGDTIADHVNALERKYPIGWLNTAEQTYMRGFPYWNRNESECVVSHGVWYGVADFDASTQLVKGIHEVDFYKGVIPRGTYFPMCIMNVAFKRKFTKYMYQAPMFGDINRFADIWGGYFAKQYADINGYSIVSGFAQVRHERASDPFVNLIKEARGVGMNERLTRHETNKEDDEYFTMYASNRKRWISFIETCDKNC